MPVQSIYIAKFVHFFQFWDPTPHPCTNGCKIWHGEVNQILPILWGENPKIAPK